MKFGLAVGGRERRRSNPTTILRDNVDGILTQIHKEIFDPDSEVIPRRIFDAAAKIERYATAAAAQLAAEGKTWSTAKAALRGWSAFIRGYVFRAGFLDGLTGLKVADYNRRYTYEKWARLAKLARS